MVLHLAALPPELRALVATKCDAATAAQFALASRACALLLRQHLAFLLEAHRQAQRDAAARQLQQALEFALSTANLHAVNAMGGSRFAINLAAHGAQTRPSTATFTCMCCGCTQRCGPAAMLSSMCCVIWLPKHIGLCTAARSTILMLMLLRGKPLWRVCRVLQAQCECRWPRVELYNLL